ncbi:MAG TPA: fumarylacetoacetate hydrolase family protein [Baekduia sp.]|nr:fumarylacetoacetate hydrolase family protein [Baekduia sp.]
MPEPRTIADALGDAVARRAAITRFTADAELDVETAYDAQWLGIQDRLAAGEQLSGLKLGLTSRAKQVTMGVDDPLYGWLTSGMLLDAADPLPLDRWIHPRVEPEIAFVMGAELTGPASIADVLAATAGVTAALEVIDSRYADFSFRLPDVVADNASAAGYVVGPRLRPVAELEDLRLLGCVLRRDGEVVHTAAGAAVMGHPAAAVAWLAGRLAASGRSIPAGAIVLSGALTDAVPLAPGATVTAELEGLGTIEVRA